MAHKGGVKTLRKLLALATRTQTAPSGGFRQADAAGNTALHRAAMEGDIRQIVLLIAQGADPAAKNRLGQTPGDLARQVQVSNRPFADLTHA